MPNNNDDTIRRNISNNITKYRKKAGLSQKELAQKLNVTPSRVSNWEQCSNSPTIDILFDVCNVLNVSISDMYGVSPTIKGVLSTSEWSFIEKYRDLDDHGTDLVDMVLQKEWERVDKYGKISDQPAARVINYYQKLASAGTGQVVFDDMTTTSIEIPADDAYKRVGYAIGVNGDSMEPLYEDGDVLLIEPTNSVEIGEIGIFLVDGEAYVKKLGHGELISLNKDRDNILLTSHSNCMGRVVGKL